MASIIIKGGNKLNGEVKISGSKNASLPIIAASILSGKKTTLFNVPDIHDTQVTLKILRYSYNLMNFLLIYTCIKSMQLKGLHVHVHGSH